MNEEDLKKALENEEWVKKFKENFKKEWDSKTHEEKKKVAEEIERCYEASLEFWKKIENPKKS